MVYPYVAVIGVDGMGNFNQKTNTPVMDALFQNGATTNHAQSMNPTISAENWGAMLLGADPMVHGLTNSIVGRVEYKNENLPSLFRRIRKAYPDALLTSCSNWNPINHGIIEHDLGAELLTADSDEELCPIIEAQVARKPKFLFVQFDQVDGAGHKHGYGSDLYLQQIEKSDGYIGRIVEAYKQAGIWEDTLFIVTADHGGHKNSHGGYNDTEKNVFLGVCGKGISKSDIEYAQTKDIAAIVLHAFCLPIPDYNPRHFSSQVPNGIFTDTTTDYQKPDPKAFRPATLPTPDLHGENGLVTRFKDKLKLALFFDGDLTDALGHYTFREHGHVKYYGDGIYGFRGEFGDTGYGYCPDFKFGDGSFSIALWLQIDKTITDDISVCGTKAYHHDRKGFEIAMQSQDTQFLFGNEQEEHIQFVTPFSDFVADGWLHTLYVVDKEKAELRLYYNFQYVRTISIPEDYLGDLDNLPFTVGNDGGHFTNDIENHQLFNMDDFLVFDGALTAEDVATLAAYYNL